MRSGIAVLIAGIATIALLSPQGARAGIVFDGCSGQIAAVEHGDPHGTTDGSYNTPTSVTNGFCEVNSTGDLISSHGSYEYAAGLVGFSHASAQAEMKSNVYISDGRFIQIGSATVNGEAVSNGVDLNAGTPPPDYMGPEASATAQTSLSGGITITSFYKYTLSASLTKGATISFNGHNYYGTSSPTLTLTGTLPPGSFGIGGSTYQSDNAQAGNAISDEAQGGIDSYSYTLILAPLQVAIVPNVVGDTRSVASNVLAQADVALGTVTTTRSSTVPAGEVISQRPLAGTRVVTQTKVNLVISSGRLPGDLNLDGVVNCDDVAIVKVSFGKKTGQTGFDPRADLNGDGIVNGTDLLIEQRSLPAGTTCH